jgi:hypothetical protein
MHPIRALVNVILFPRAALSTFAEQSLREHSTRGSIPAMDTAERLSRAPNSKVNVASLAGCARGAR